MRIQKNTGIWVITAMVLLTACKESYEPPVVKENLDLLVVDGFINNSADT
ncbi:MAG: hypothetical protein ABUT20_13305, partial [Bacteroidota bacterium]